MLPIPKAILDIYPIPCDVLGRPWWHDEAGDGDCAVRTDGASGLYGAYSNQPAVSVEAIDADRPIPHPGFRVGQIWAYMDGEEVCAVTITEHYPQRMAWYVSGECYTDEELAGLLRDAFLLADPVCPHLAPWAPVA